MDIIERMKKAQKFAWANWDALVLEALQVKEIIYTNGGIATKSAVENVLMAKHGELDRGESHSILNHIEFQNFPVAGHDPDMAEWAEFFASVRIKWFHGNPFEVEAV